MVEDIPEIAKLDLSPVFVRQHGAIVADARVRLARCGAGPAGLAEATAGAIRHTPRA